jgi:amino acid adenylation domain-containing protein
VTGPAERTRRERGVAVIGMACLFPGAAGPAEFHASLAAGRELIRPPAEERVRQAGAPVGADYVPMGYLDRVDLFDHEFFGLPLREAELMDPQQRLLLQLTHQALESSGHPPGRLRGSRTGVFVGAAPSGYGELCTGDDPQQLLGTLPAALAARIAYLFDLHGPAVVLDTACSSGLAAVAAAMAAIRGQQLDLAVAAAASLRTVLVPWSEHRPLRGVDSPDATCRPFDARANGAVGGEGGAVLVLRPLAAALAAGDTIHAVLTGAAANHNGHRAVSMGAPSPVAQAAVVAEACRDAGVGPGSIGYVECHGSATPLGDAVELDAVRRAYGDDPARSACLIGSVKGNIGHLDAAAGLAGLVKAILSVREGVLYPAVGFATPNPQADLGPLLRVNTELRNWPDQGGAPRRAGVSSLGLTGTNVHVVLEQPPAAPAAGAGAPRAGGELLTVSAASAAALARYCRQLAGFLRQTDHPLWMVAHTVNRGRDQHPYRLAFTVDSAAAAADALDAAVPPGRPAAPAAPTVLLFSADGQLDEPHWAGLCAAFPELADLLPELVAEVGAEPADPAGRLVFRQYALYRLAGALGLTGDRLVGCGAGNLVVRAARGELSIPDAVRAAAGAATGPRLDLDRLAGAVAGFEASGALLVEMGAGGVLSRETRRLAAELPVLPLFAGADRAAVLAQVGRLYALGAAIDWDRYYAGADLPWIDAPTYPFAPTRCWCGPPGPAAVPAGPAATAGPGIAEPAPAPAGPAIAGPAPAGGRVLVERVAAIWSAVLKVPGVRPDSDYFALGGTSIAGISVLRDIEREFGVRLGFADLYAHPTAAALAERIGAVLPECAPTSPPPVIPRLPRGGPLPLSFGQEQLWYLEQLNPNSALYNLPIDLHWTGPLDLAALAAALRDLADRHEVLRSRIASADGVPYVLIADRGPELDVLDLTAGPAAARETGARAAIGAAATRPFDLAAGPLWRALLIRLAADDHVLAATWHHIVFDGWSPSVFFDDLAELYRARVAGQPPVLPELAAQYADVAGWQRDRLAGPLLEQGLAHWRDRLAGLRRAELPLDRPRPPGQRFAGGLVEFSIPAAVADRMREFSRQRGVTPFVTMLAAVSALLHRWAGTADVVIGVATAGRGHPATHRLVGYFNNVLPFRTAVTGQLPFADILTRTAGTVSDVLDHEDIPFDRIVSALGGRRDPARHPVFDVAYTHQNAPTPTAALPGTPAGLYRGSAIAGIAPGTAKFDLTLGVVDQASGAMPAHVEYATALFDRATADRLAGWFGTLLAAVLHDPDRRIDSIPLPGLPGTARPAAPAPASAPAPAPAPAQAPAPAAPAAPELWWQVVERMAADRPDHPAVVCAGRPRRPGTGGAELPETGGSYSYRQLNQMANRLARRLLAAGVGPERPVPVVAGRGIELVVGWLAVAKAGGAFVPVDPALPGPRIDTILSDVDAAVAVVGPRWSGRRLAADQLPVELTGAAGPDPAARAGAGNLAYLCYTSGSNGRPHGCQIEHGQLTAVIGWYQDAMRMSAAEQVLQGAWPSFDTTIMEVFATLCSGATLHLADAAVRDPATLPAWLAEHGITSAFLPTPIAEVLLADGRWPAGARLRILSTGGDQLHVRPHPGTPFRLLNMYGPTECTIVATAGPVGTGPGGGLPDIGGPISGTSVYLLDGRGRPVDAGELGEVHLGGVVVGRGYHRLPGLTATRFLADPFAGRPNARMYRTGDLGRLRPDGTIEFHGRADNQVEVRGYRVEPAEVEEVLGRHPGVREALVVGVAGPGGGTRLVAHVTAAGPVPAERELLDWVAAELPGHLVPARVLAQPSLPRTVNGKLDRRQARRLPVPTAGPAAAGEPAAAGSGGAGRGPELVLADICADLLGAGPVDPDDNFFELGGDSLLGIRLAVRAANAGIHFGPPDLLRCGSLRELAATAPQPPAPIAPAAAAAPAHLDRAGGGPSHAVPAGSGPAAAGPVRRHVPPTPVMYGFLDGLPADLADFVDTHVLAVPAAIDPGLLPAAVAHLVAVNEPLRYRFRRNELGWHIRCLDPPAAAVDAVDVRLLPPLCPAEEAAVLERDAATLAGQLDLTHGPVLRLRHYRRDAGQDGLILLVAHHFVFDSVSAVVLVEDLDAALAGLAAGWPPAVDPRRPAWRMWSEHLQDVARSDELAAELTYWTGILRAGATGPRLPRTPAGRDPEHPGIVPREAVHREFPWPPGPVGPGSAAAADAAVGALAAGVARWQGRPEVCVMLEGAGTPNPYRPGGRPPAVGWFTSLHPALLPADPRTTGADRLRAVPNDGIGYGVLRHLAPMSPALAELRSLPEPDVLIAYQANPGGLLAPGAGLLQARPELYPPPRRRVTGRFPVALRAAVGPDLLQVSILPAAGIDPAQVQALAGAVEQAFAELAGAEVVGRA